MLTVKWGSKCIIVCSRTLYEWSALREERRTQLSWELRECLVEAGCLNQVLMQHMLCVRSVTFCFCKVYIYICTV